MAKKSRAVYVCEACGVEAPKWFGRCSSCGEYNTATEVDHAPSLLREKSRDLGVPVEYDPPRPITQVREEAAERIRTGMLEFDRVLGGGMVPGSMILLGGDPGIGKSTLMLQVADTLARRGLRVLYVSGEESAQQIRIRGERLNALNDNLYLMTRTALEEILAEPELRQADFVIVDSLQSIASVHLDAAAGSVPQVREVAVKLTRFAKASQTPLMIIGHVTKEGVIAGPKLVEHVVDCVLTFEGDMYQAYRLLRTSKNRFGPTHELGIFEMLHDGLREVENPSEIFLTQRTRDAVGAVVVPVQESSRVLLAEIQALVTKTSFGNARRATSGLDVKRVLLIAAVLEKHLHLEMASSDIFVNIAGGLRVGEPAVDIGAAAAILSSQFEVPLPRSTVYIGELSLTGEVRSVSQVQTRIKEALNRGFRRVVLAREAYEGLHDPPEAEFVPVATIRELLEREFGQP